MLPVFLFSLSSIESSRSTFFDRKYQLKDVIYNSFHSKLLNAEIKPSANAMKCFVFNYNRYTNYGGYFLFACDRLCLPYWTKNPTTMCIANTFYTWYCCDKDHRPISPNSISARWTPNIIAGFFGFKVYGYFFTSFVNALIIHFSCILGHRIRYYYLNWIFSFGTYNCTELARWI